MQKSDKPDKTKLKLKQLLILLLIFSAISGLLVLADRAPSHLEKRFPSAKISDDFTFYYNGVIEKTLPGPYIYRILIPYSVFIINKIIPFVKPIDVDFFLKFIILIISQLSFYLFMRLFFPDLQAICGVFLLDVLTGFSLSYFQGSSIAETSDLFNMTIFTLILISLYKDSFSLTCIFLFIGMLNRETPFLLLPIIFLYDYINKKGFLRSITAASSALIPYIILHLIITESDPRWLATEGITRNIPFIDSSLTYTAILSNLRLIFLIGPLIFLSLYKFKNQPRFLKIISSVVPLFIIVHYIFGTIIEARLWMPVFILLIPLSIGTLFNILENK